MEGYINGQLSHVDLLQVEIVPSVLSSLVTEKINILTVSPNPERVPASIVNGYIKGVLNTNTVIGFNRDGQVIDTKEKLDALNSPMDLYMMLDISVAGSFDDISLSEKGGLTTNDLNAKNWGDGPFSTGTVDTFTRVTGLVQVPPKEEINPGKLEEPIKDIKPEDNKEESNKDKFTKLLGNNHINGKKTI